ncbi:MAG: 3-hydroxyacyl-CoA dehydrogenase NAD-binding domain-containing protein [bacterium]|nr:3-hydroxyacyl-CoA dehydrogenase NAD-binding domain-containing protein [bacterium]
MTVAILGAGTMGCALATLLAANNYRVRLWSVESDVVRDIATHHRTKKYLPDVILDAERISATGDLAGALVGADGVVFAVPSTAVALVARDARPFLARGAAVLCVAKGIDGPSFSPLPAVIARTLGRARGSVAGLAGPAVAAEFVAGTPTAVVIAGTLAATRLWQRAFARPTFTVQRSRDLIGISWAAALKNVYAIGLGMCDGMAYATNTKALLMERALAEMVTVLRRVRARPETAYGLAGLGDLVTTGFAPSGRNRTFGEMICASADCDIPALLTRMTVEGVAASAVAHAWAECTHTTLPLLNMIWRVCHEHADPCDTLAQYLEEAYA